MKGKAKRKVVTSGRLTGAGAVSRQVTQNPRPAACPEPAYSLYSTDSEEQVATLHKGLDRCAALLSGILQADKAASPCLPRTAKDRAARSKLFTSQGKKTVKKLPTQTDQRRSQSGQCEPGCKTPRTHQSTAPTAHSGVKLHPPQKKVYKLLQSHLAPTVKQLSYIAPQRQTSTPPLQPSILLSVHQSSSPSGQLPLHQTDCQSVSEAPHTQCKAECDGGEDFIPVRDLSIQSTATVAHTLSNIHTCTMKMLDMQVEAGQDSTAPDETQRREECSAKTEVKAETGSVAETLLRYLEQAVSAPQISVGSSNIQTESTPDLSSLLSHNTQLCRHVRILTQQLKERTKMERHQNLEILRNPEGLSLQEELTTAHSRLEELQDDFTKLQKVLQDTQSQLRDREAENALMKTELAVTRSQLLDSEQEKMELASVAQQRLEEIGNLNRFLRSQCLPDCPTVYSSVSDTKQHFSQNQHGQNPPVPPTDRITKYLMSLGQMKPTHTEHVCVAAEREGNALELRKTLPHPNVRSEQSDKPAEPATHQRNAHLDQSRLDEVPMCEQPLEKKPWQLCTSTLYQCDVESVWSNWSMKSGSTFDTRDEAAFRDGLAALDASIASLQKTMQLDLRR